MNLFAIGKHADGEFGDMQEDEYSLVECTGKDVRESANATSCVFHWVSTSSRILRWRSKDVSPFERVRAQDPKVNARLNNDALSRPRPVSFRTIQLSPPHPIQAPDKIA
ncbi:hypothetical protein E4J90_14600 [Pseudomonas kribbensis]|uniref:Uncharacterized protein n=1 Tax=Pseudomonas kribbensis TaxID=1628086 RepID=A0A4Y8VG80_9PSED|nr:hypothetical protein E4J90_14600 [Pseudomonas kribbensis]